MIGKRRLLTSTAGLLVAGWSSSRAQAKYPSKAIKIVVPRVPGGGTDILMRLLAPGLEKKFGVPIIIDNRPDTTVVVGAIVVAKAKPDGQTFLATDNAFYQNPAIIDSLPYDTFKDYSAVTMVAKEPVILIVHPSVPSRPLQDLIALGKTTNLTFASGGIGASTHLVGVMVNPRAGINITHVPFKGSGPTLNALLSGHVSMQYGGLSPAAPYIKDGKIRTTALTGDKRDPSMLDVPTFQESGPKDADVDGIWGLHALPGTPIEIRRVLHAAVGEVMRDPETAQKLAERGYSAIVNTPEEQQAHTEALVNQWIEVGRKVNLKE